MAKNKRKKVKRYSRSFYSRSAKIKRAVGFVVLVLAVLAVAWIAAPHVLDWATHTWYTVVKNRDLDAPPASASSVELPASSAEPELPQQPEITEPEQPQPEPLDGKAVGQGSWARLERSELTYVQSITAAAQRLAQQGTAYALITLKEPSGSVYYSSAVAGASASIAQTTVDAALIAQTLRDSGIIPVAQICAFQDPLAAYTDRSMAIHYSAEMLWLDNVSAAAGGKPWLNPYADSAVQFVGDLVEELRTLGYEQVVITGVQFPKVISAKQDFGATGGKDRAAQLRADIAAWQTRFEDRVTLWFGYTVEQFTQTTNALGAPAAQLGMENLLLTADAMDIQTRETLEQTATQAGVAQLVVCDDSNDFQ